MGSIISRANLVWEATLAIKRFLSTLSERLEATPGLPVDNPSLSFWTIPRSSISSEGKPTPDHADILIIGSGITGTSVAYHALKEDGKLNVVMLEAREVCSGATGRNGGHINPPLFQDWKELKEKFGDENAKKLIRFRLAHFRDMSSVAASEGIAAECQVRETEHVEVHATEDTFKGALEGLEAWKTEMPEEAESFTASIGADASQNFHLSKGTAGVIAGPGGAIHPYRFVTALLAILLKRYEENFFIATQTPATEILPPSSSCPYYTVITPTGSITTTHIVHATNGWVSHLVEPMREKIVPVRGTMSAQRPGTMLGPSTLSGDRSFVFYSSGLGYEYLTQLPTGEKELMFGGGWASLNDIAMTDFGMSNDSGFSISVASHLAGVLPYYFGTENWGREKNPSTDENDEGEVKWEEGRTKSQWSGILGISADGLPWVGRLSPKISGRAAPQSIPPSKVRSIKNGESKSLESPSPSLAAPGEWICAGYTGEGMVHAWMSGKALACMIQDSEQELESWFPEMLQITEERWKEAELEEFIASKLRTLM